MLAFCSSIKVKMNTIAIKISFAYLNALYPDKKNWF